MNALDLTNPRVIGRLKAAIRVHQEQGSLRRVWRGKRVPPPVGLPQPHYVPALKEVFRQKTLKQLCAETGESYELAGNKLKYMARRNRAALFAKRHVKYLEEWMAQNKQDRGVTLRYFCARRRLSYEKMRALRFSMRPVKMSDAMRQVLTTYLSRRTTKSIAEEYKLPYKLLVFQAAYWRPKAEEILALPDSPLSIPSTSDTIDSNA